MKRGVQKYQGVRQNKTLIAKISTQSLFAILIFFSLMSSTCKKIFLPLLHQMKLKHPTTGVYFISFLFIFFFKGKYISLKICRDKSFIMS